VIIILHEFGNLFAHNNNSKLSYHCLLLALVVIEALYFYRLSLERKEAEGDMLKMIIIIIITRIWHPLLDLRVIRFDNYC
jgi:hypothetical protein